MKFSIVHQLIIEPLILHLAWHYQIWEVVIVAGLRRIIAISLSLSFNKPDVQKFWFRS